MSLTWCYPVPVIGTALPVLAIWILSIKKDPTSSLCSSPSSQNSSQLSIAAQERYLDAFLADFPLSLPSHVL